MARVSKRKLQLRERAKHLNQYKMKKRTEQHIQITIDSANIQLPSEPTSPSQPELPGSPKEESMQVIESTNKQDMDSSFSEEDENKDIELLFSLGIHEKLRETEKRNQQLEKSLKSMQTQLKKQENLSIRYLEAINSLNQQLKEKEEQLKKLSKPPVERLISISYLCNPQPSTSLTEQNIQGCKYRQKSTTSTTHEKTDQRTKFLVAGVGVGLGVGLGFAWLFSNPKSTSRNNRTRRNVKIRRRTHNESEMDSSESADNLDDEQLEKVAKFISHQTAEISTSKAIQLLKESNWNIEAANKLLKEESEVRTHGNMAVQANARGGWFSSIWNFGYSFVASFLAPPVELNPEAASAKFLRDFETIYGEKHPTFIQGSFQQASQKAKREYKFLVVYLHSKNHQDTDKFCRETLATEIMADFINENFLCWAGDLSFAEPYKLSSMLGAAVYPFIAVITNNSIGGMTILDRIEGCSDTDTLMLRLSVVLEHHGPLLMQAKIEHEEREADRRIREEQDRAFRQSLAEDEEKQRKVMEEERKQKEESERIEKEEILRKRKLEEKQKRKEKLRQSLPPEPELSDGVSQLVIRLTDGSRIQRRFKKSDTLGNVFDFVDSSPHEMNGDYDLVTNFPRRVFSDRTMTLEQAGLYPHGALFVQEK